MKKIYLLVMAVVVMCTAVFAQNHYNGNNNTGFGKPVGLGSIDVTNDGTNLTFQFNKGSGDLNDVLVIYLDAYSGGYSTTANFTDDADGLRKAVSGYGGNASQRATFNFYVNPNGNTDSTFTPEYAVAFQPKSSSAPAGVSGVYTLQENGSFTFSPVTIFTPDDAPTYSTYTVSVPIQTLGFIDASTVKFKFVVTYISNTAYRSNEAIGDPMTDFTGQGWASHTEDKTPVYYPINVLPVTFGNVTAKLYNKTVSINWNSLSETNTKSYLVQKSADGSSFATIYTIPAQNKSTGAAYTYTDNSQLTANNYYRIVAVDKDGRQTTSRIVSVANIAGAASVRAYFTSHVLNIKMSNPAAAKYEFVLFAANGQRIASTVYQHPGGESSTTLPAAASLPKGVYYLSAQTGTQQQSIRVFVP